MAIQEKHSRLGSQCPGQSHSLLLSAGKLSYAPPPESFEIDQCKCSSHSFVQRVASDPQRLESERDILPDVEVGKQGIMLKHHSESPANRLDSGNVFVD